jgi:urease accessory protein
METFVLIDPLLPTGSFAHSLGLEPARIARAVETLDETSHEASRAVETFARECAQSAIDAQLPFALAAHAFALRANAKHAREGDDDDDATRAWRAANAECSALCASNAVQRRASASTGAALLRASIVAFGEERSWYLTAIKRTLRRPPPLGLGEAHHACVFGAVSAIANLEADACARAYVYCVMRDVCSAATRLNASGPLETVAVLRRCVEDAEAACAVAVADFNASTARALTTTTTDGDEVEDHEARTIMNHLRRAPATSSPIYDVVQGAHDRARARLFNS